MPMINIQGIDLPYDEADIITFDEGLVGLPHLRRMVLVRNTDIAPFHWLVALDEDHEAAFLVANPREIFPDYAPQIEGQNSIEAASTQKRESVGSQTDITVLAIATIQPQWVKSTINLRAPLFIAANEMRGQQVILSNSPYKHDEPLSRHAAA